MLEINYLVLESYIRLFELLVVFIQILNETNMQITIVMSLVMVRAFPPLELLPVMM